MRLVLNYLKNYINTIETIYDLIKSHKTKKASILFDQWKIYFQEICGYDFKSFLLLNCLGFKKILTIVFLQSFFDLSISDK